MVQDMVVLMVEAMVLHIIDLEVMEAVMEVMALVMVV